MAFVSAAASQGAIPAIPRLPNYTNISVVTAETHSASGWVIFLSFWVMFYQGLAILQLFLHVKFAYTTVPYINWSIFFLVVRL